jgi:hypothetical protein
MISSENKLFQSLIAGFHTDGAFKRHSDDSSFSVISGNDIIDTQRRGDRVADGAALEKRWARASWVRIPPSPPCFLSGEVLEWPNRRAWKARVASPLPWVRIPSSPPCSSPIWRFEQLARNPREYRLIGSTLMKNSCKKSGSLTEIPGVGKSIAQDLNNIGIYTVSDLKNKDPELLYNISNEYAGVRQDKCLLYVYRTAVYYANGGRRPDKLKWWNWKDKVRHSRS